MSVAPVWGASMNWSRGLLRMWVAFTVVWICVVLGSLYLDRPQDVEPVQSTAPVGKIDWVIENPKKAANYFDMFDPGTPAYKRRVFWQEAVPGGVKWAIAVPVGLFIAGCRGLRSS
jgi:hypothetical protein